MSMGLLDRIGSILESSDLLLRELRRDARALSEQLSALIGRAEMVRLRSAQVQDLLMGVFSTRPSSSPSLSKLPDEHYPRPPVNFEPVSWPIPLGAYDTHGHSEKLGYLARIGLLLAYAEVGMMLAGITQEQRPTVDAQRQLFMAFRALSTVLTSSNLTEEDYQALWRRLLTKEMPPGS